MKVLHEQIKWKLGQMIDRTIDKNTTRNDRGQVYQTINLDIVDMIQAQIKEETDEQQL